MKRRTKGLLAAAVVGLSVTALCALDPRLTVRTYTVSTHKLSAPVRLALVTDLHSCRYGQGQEELLTALDQAAPDVVLLGGDIVDDQLPEEPAWTFLEAAARRYVTCYVTGNHEFWSGQVEEIKAKMARLGVIVLEGEAMPLVLDGQFFLIAGVDDPEAGEGVWQEQLSACAAAADETHVSLLLSHRPERVSAYTGLGFDLVLAGHAHGGQWRLPGLVNGLLAPNQGLFPAYAGGCYQLDDTTHMIVSRGLARESTRVPRLFNRPELVLVDLEPA